MGNENEINKMVNKKTDPFFKNELARRGEDTQMYALESEFAKTKKNKQPFFYLSVIFFVAALVVATILITTVIRRGTKDIKIDITDFKSLDLTELFNSAQKIETKLRNAQQALYDLRQTMNGKISIVRDNMESERQLLYTKSLSPSRRKSAMRDIRRKELYRIALIRNRYVGQIIAKQKEIARLRKEVTKTGKRLKRGQVVLDNFNKLKDMESRKIRNRYENRISELRKAQRNRLRKMRAFHSRYVDSLILLYNPQFQSSSLQAIVNDALAMRGVQRSMLPSYPALLSHEGIFTPQQFVQLQSAVKHDFALIDRLLSVPYTNYAAKGLRSINKLTTLSVSMYEMLWQKMLQVMRRKNMLISQYRGAIDMMAKNAREHGYVINAENKNSVVVVVNDRYYVRNGDEGYVLRSGKKKIASLRFYNVRDGVRAKITKLAPNTVVRPFDKVIIKLK